MEKSLNLLPVKKFPPLPGEEFHLKRTTGSRLVQRVSKHDQIRPLVRRLKIYFRDDLSEEETYITLRKEIATILKKYGKKASFPGRDGSIISVLSKPVILKDGDKTFRFGRFDIQIHNDYWGFHIMAKPIKPKPGTSGFPHPHISESGCPCLGDGYSRIMDALEEGFFSDVFTMMSHHIMTYNPNEAMQRLDEWDGETPCPSCGMENIDHLTCDECGVVGCNLCFSKNMDDVDADEDDPYLCDSCFSE